MNAGSQPKLSTELSGLIYGYVFSEDGRGQQIDTATAATWLEQRDHHKGFIWLHFDSVHVATAGWIRKYLNPSDAFTDALHQGSRSTRIESSDESLVAVVNDVVYELIQESSLRVATLWLNVDSRCLLSVRGKSLRSVDRLHEAVKSRESFRSPLSLVIHLLRDQADVLIQIMRETTAKVDDFEDRLFADRIPDRSLLGNIRRDLIRLQRMLAPEPAALFRLLNRPPAWIAEEDAQDLRESTEEFSVVLRDLTGLQERIKLLQEEIVALISERMNRSVFVLTAVTVLALPINLTAGLFGMNVGGIPYSENPDGFWIVLTCIIMVTIAAIWIAFRKNIER